MMASTQRCFGNKKGQELYARYHDDEWGVAIYDDQKLFECLCLEGAQAGLSFFTVLKKRENYRRLFYNFNIQKCALLETSYLQQILLDKGIIRNHLKVYSIRKNAGVFLQIQKEHESFANYLWGYTNNKVIKNKWQTKAQMPSSSDLSAKISKDLKKRGMSFVGATIIYAYLQAVGVINDHYIDCIKY